MLLIRMIHFVTSGHLFITKYDEKVTLQLSLCRIIIFAFWKKMDSDVCPNRVIPISCVIIRTKYRCFEIFYGDLYSHLVR